MPHKGGLYKYKVENHDSVLNLVIYLNSIGQRR